MSKFYSTYDEASNAAHKNLVHQAKHCGWRGKHIGSKTRQQLVKRAN